MQPKKIGISTILTLGMLPMVGVAGPSGHQPLAALVKQADAIVVGRTSNVTSVAPNVATTINILRVLKGTPVAGEQILGLWTSGGSTSVPVGATGVVGVWFLKAGQSGQWDILPLMTGDVPYSMTYLQASAEPPAGPYSILPGMDPFEKLTCEIASALERSDGKSQLAVFLTRGPVDSPTPITNKTWAHIAESSIPTLRILGLQILIRSGDAAALARFTSEAEALSDVVKQSPFAMSVCDFRNPQDEAILSLDTLAKAGGLPAQLRKCAAHALRGMHTQKTLPSLAALLDADSADLRYEGVAGLASFANALPIQTTSNFPSMGNMQPTGQGLFTNADTLRHFPTVPSFRKDEMRYLSFWKAWWAVHQTELSK